MGPDLLLLVLAEFGGDLEDDDDEALFESFSDFCFELLGPGLPPEGSLA